jgi:FtsZ-binding cell division protein ZapB
MRYSIRFLFFVLLVSAITALVFTDRQKLQREIESLQEQRQELRKIVLQLELKIANEELSGRNASLRSLMQKSQQRIPDCFPDEIGESSKINEQLPRRSQ